MLLTLSMLSFAGCQTAKVETVEVPVSSHCTGENCFSVTEAFMVEHGQTMIENIRLKNKLKICQERTP